MALRSVGECRNWAPVQAKKNDPSERTERVIFVFATVFLRPTGGFVKRLEQFRETPIFRCAPDTNRTCDLRYRKPTLYPLSYEGNAIQV